MPEMKNRTKSQLDLALRTLLKEKSLDQIRVRELTELCGIRRQSFYYHFADVYELFSWSVEQTGAALAARRENCLMWQQVFQDLLCYISENRDYCRAVRDALGRQGLQLLFGSAVSELLEQTSAYYRRRCGAEEDPAAAAAQNDYAAAVFLGLLDGWLGGDLQQSPQALTAQVEQSVRLGVLGALWQNFPRWGQT